MREKYPRRKVTPLGVRKNSELFMLKIRIDANLMLIKQ